MTRYVFMVSILFAATAALAACVPSLPPGTQDCVGFPAEICERHIAEIEREGEARGGVIAYRIVCTSGRCDVSQGEGSETVVFADGTGREGNFGYATAVGTPQEQIRGPLPVVPVCLGVPVAWCGEMARAGADSVADWSSILAITVHCSGTCTTTKGEGETRIRLADGPDQVMGWDYDGGPGPPP